MEDGVKKAPASADALFHDSGNAENPFRRITR